jgi:hypothetical protein
MQSVTFDKLGDLGMTIDHNAVYRDQKSLIFSIGYAFVMLCGMVI